MLQGHSPHLWSFSHCSDDLDRRVGRFIHPSVEWVNTFAQFVRNLSGARYLLTCGLGCFFSWKTKKKERVVEGLWSEAFLLSGKSSPLRPLLLGLWNVLRLKTQFMRLGAWCCCSFSCKSWPRQSISCLWFCYGPVEGSAVVLSLVLGKDCNCTECKSCFCSAEHSKASVNSRNLNGKGLLYCVRVLSLFVMDCSSKLKCV